MLSEREKTGLAPPQRGGETVTARLEAGAGSNAGIRYLDRCESTVHVSYAELRDRASAIAGGLKRIGIENGDRVAIIVPTSPAFCDAFFGVLWAGAIPVPLYPPANLGRLDEYHDATARRIRACDARLILTEPRVRRLLGRTTQMAAPDLGCVSIDDVPRSDVASHGAAPEDVALIQFSSGTTGAPKPIQLSHRALIANVGAISATLRSVCGSDVRVVCWLPLYHDMGLVGCLINSVVHSFDLTLIPPEVFVAKPALWLRALSRFQGNASPAPSFAYSLCTDRIRDEELEGVDLSNWSVALNGAEPVAPSALLRFVERFSRWGFRPEAMSPVYGLAEATLAVTFSDLKRTCHVERFDEEKLAVSGHAVAQEQGRAVASVGRPLSGIDVRIVDDGWNDLSPGKVGRVLVQSPSVMEGYYGMSDATREVLRDGWLDTGDAGFLHGGELYLYGRNKDLIIIRGRNYAPQDVEHALDGIDGVRTGCVVALGVPSEDGEGEALWVFAERAKGVDRDLDGALADTISERVIEATRLVPQRVVVLEPGTLPRTPSGKLRRAETWKRWQRQALVPPSKVGPLTVARAMLGSAVAFARARKRAA